MADAGKRRKGKQQADKRVFIPSQYALIVFQDRRLHRNQRDFWYFWSQKYAYVCRRQSVNYAFAIFSATALKSAILSGIAIA